MKYLCRDLLTMRELEGVNNATDLFVVLEQRKELGSGNFHLLEDLLTQIGRGDLVRKLKDFERLERKQQNGRIVCVANDRHDRRKDGFLNHRHLQDDCVTDGKQAITMPGSNKEFGHQESLAPRENQVMLRNVSAGIYEKLGFLLNPVSFKCWRHLAGKLGYTYTPSRPTSS
ncbi:peptidase C14A [Desmophyllum pertusum]|uniref:Peptidase C14A n=1 Tax=Desmophyllum pertusum TaxID=174260 RepID=A0A9X0CDL0_9CNID|nr:peptidase C14A [Desmophyllum pertusum]